MLPVVEEMKRVRQAYGVSRRQVANALGVSLLSVAKWETAGVTPRKEMQQRIAQWSVAQHATGSAEMKAAYTQQEDVANALADYVRAVYSYRSVLQRAIRVLRPYNAVAAEAIEAEAMRIIIGADTDTKETGESNPFSEN